MERTELRKFPRTKVDFPVTYRLAGKSHRARAVVLGGNGLHLQISEPLASGTEMTVRFRPAEHLPVVEALARVRYQVRGKEVGIEFTEIKPQDRQVILRLILSRLRAKRKHPRRPLVVQVEHDAGSFLAFSRNISVGGMFIQTEKQLSTGSRIRLRFPLDDGGPTIVASADVRYAVIGQGMGVKFIVISPGDRSRIDVYVTKGEASVTTPDK